MARQAGKGGFSDGSTLWFVNNDTNQAVAYLASDQSRQAADDITHADLAGQLRGSVYANGIVWFVEPDQFTAIAFVDPNYVSSNVYIGSNRITKVYVGSAEVDRIYVGSTQVF